MPKTPDYFRGKTVIITGAASGIGRAAALVFAREGANVVCADINEAGVEQTVEQVNTKYGDAGGQTLALTIDVTKRAAVKDMMQLALDDFGSVQFLFNSAGAALRRSKFLDIDDELFDRTFDLNVKGTFYAMQAALPHMLANNFGVIVNMGSMSHRRGGPGSSVHYASAKGAVVTMTWAWRANSPNRVSAQCRSRLGLCRRRFRTRRRPRRNSCRNFSTTCRWAASPHRRKSPNWCCSCARTPASS